MDERGNVLNTTSGKVFLTGLVLVALGVVTGVGGLLFMGLLLMILVVSFNKAVDAANRFRKLGSRTMALYIFAALVLFVLLQLVVYSVLSAQAPQP